MPENEYMIDVYWLYWCEGEKQLTTFNDSPTNLMKLIPDDS